MLPDPPRNTLVQTHMTSIWGSQTCVLCIHTYFADHLSNCSVICWKSKKYLKWYIYTAPFPCNMLKGTLQWSIYLQRTRSIYRHLWQPLQSGSCTLVTQSVEHSLIWKCPFYFCCIICTACLFEFEHMQSLVFRNNMCQYACQCEICQLFIDRLTWPSFQTPPSCTDNKLSPQ